MPETFKMSIDLEGYDYHLQANSVFAHAAWLVSVAEGKEVSEKDEQRIRNAEKDGEGMPGFQRFEYEGQGRFALDLDLKGTLKKAGDVIGFPNTKTRSKTRNFMTIARNDDGTVEIFTPKMSEKKLANLKRLGMHPSGILTIHTDGKVLNSNAVSQRGEPLDKGYSWNINSWDDAIYMQIDPNQ